MKASVYYETGGPEVFRYEDVPDPIAADGGVIVKVEYISIEGGDSLHRSGGVMSSVPHIVGYQCAGVVEEVGAGVEGLVVGDRVVTVGLDGSYAEFRVRCRAGILLEDTRRVVDRARCLHSRCLRNRPRLPLRVREAERRGVGSRAGRCERRRHCRDPDGQERRCTRACDGLLRSKLERLSEFGLDDGINYAQGSVVGKVLLTHRRTWCRPRGGICRRQGTRREPGMPRIQGEVRVARRRR